MNDQRFAAITEARRVWAIGAIHGEAARLERMHELIAERFEPGDCIVYLGNMLGRGPDVATTVDMLLEFRLAVMAVDPREAASVFFLRGSQEEMWQKLLQLQFATNPKSVMAWMLQHGVDATLRAYGCTAEEAQHQASVGTVALTRWTLGLRERIRGRPGHLDLMTALRRAAFDEKAGLLFVSAGLDPTRPLEAQKDSFWWGSAAFDRIDEPYAGFHRVVRGFSPERPGLHVTDVTVTLDGGCGRGGSLLSACLLPSGEIVETLEA